MRTPAIIMNVILYLFLIVLSIMGISGKSILGMQTFGSMFWGWFILVFTIVTAIFNIIMWVSD